MAWRRSGVRIPSAPLRLRIGRPMSRDTRARVVLVLVAGALLGTQIWSLVTAGASSQPPTGPELATSLGLEPVTSFPLVGCQYAAEANGDLYCFDGHVSDEVE